MPPSLPRTITAPMPLLRLHAGTEATLAGLLAALAYAALQGELPYHDAARFAEQTASNAFVWDIAHVLLQPAARAAHALLGGTDPTLSLKVLSTASTAVAVGLFHLLLLRLGLPRWQAVVGTLMLAASCSVLTLAPSAHPKLVAFPFVNAALLLLAPGERGGMRRLAPLAGAGAMLAVSAGFLASALATAPFASLAVLWAARRGGLGWGAALLRAAVFAGACGAVFALIVGAGYIAFAGGELSLSALAGSVQGKSDLRPPAVPLAVHAARVVFGTVNNLVAVPGLGAMAQAMMRGQVPSLAPYAGLLPVLVLWLACAAFIGAAYLAAARGLLVGRPCLVPVAFLAGAQAWTIWYGLNDPEHWFQLTAPTLVLFLTLMPAWSVRVLMPAWGAVAVAANLALFAVPTAAYPVARHAAEIGQRAGPNDLLVGFAAYPGRAYLGFLPVPGVPRLMLDIPFQDPKVDVEAALAAGTAQIARTLQAGGRVLLFDVLDLLDWDAPWSLLLARGVTKERLTDHLQSRFVAVRQNGIGGLGVWELRPRP